MGFTDMNWSIYPWKILLREAIKGYVQEHGKGLSETHIQETPNRVVEAFSSYVSGTSVDPKQYLATVFDADKHNQMIHVENIMVKSVCAHHLAPIVGKAHFAYVPDKGVVGLSKIPRFIEALSKRLQVQENLTDQIVDTFQECVQPKGCGVVIRAYHFCMIARGIEEPASYTRTTALRGVFLDNTDARHEFLSSISLNEVIFP